MAASSNSDHWYTSLIYNLGIRSYSGAVAAASLHSDKCKKMRRGQKDTWRILEHKIEPGQKYVWIHTASLGEFEQGRPLIERIRRTRKDLKILLTFFSPSGYEVRKNYAEADAVCYLPFDTPANARRFVEMVQPVMAIFVKYEFWRNYLLELERRGTPTYLISAVFRPDQLFFRKGGGWYRRLLHCFSRIFVQDESSSHLLESAGVHSAVVAGDTRFDRVTDIMAGRRELPLLEAFRGNRFTFMAGSSWPADEDIYFPWLDAHPEVGAVIAPHEFDRVRVERLVGRFPGQAVTWSYLTAHPEATEGKRILIMDCFGLLSSAYRYADMAYVGGGFGAGLHNINEAAVYGIPVIFGPNNHKFIEARELKAAGGGFEVNSSSDFSRSADKLLSDAALCKTSGEAAGRYIASKLGATDKIFAQLFA